MLTLKVGVKYLGDTDKIYITGYYLHFVYFQSFAGCSSFYCTTAQIICVHLFIMLSVEFKRWWDGFYLGSHL